MMSAREVVEEEDQVKKMVKEWKKLAKIVEKTTIYKAKLIM